MSETRHYINDKKIEKLFEELLRLVVRKKPDNPIKFLISVLQDEGDSLIKRKQIEEIFPSDGPRRRPDRRKHHDTNLSCDGQALNIRSSIERVLPRCFDPTPTPLPENDLVTDDSLQNCRNDDESGGICVEIKTGSDRENGDDSEKREESEEENENVLKNGQESDEQSEVSTVKVDESEKEDECGPKNRHGSDKESEVSSENREGLKKEKNDGSENDQRSDGKFKDGSENKEGSEKQNEESAESEPGSNRGSENSSEKRKVSEKNIENVSENKQIPDKEKEGVSENREERNSQDIPPDNEDNSTLVTKSCDLSELQSWTQGLLECESVDVEEDNRTVTQNSVRRVQSAAPPPTILTDESEDMILREEVFKMNTATNTANLRDGQAIGLCKTVFFNDCEEDIPLIQVKVIPQEKSAVLQTPRDAVYNGNGDNFSISELSGSPWTYAESFN